MATEDPQPPSPATKDENPTASSSSSSKKRKTALPELEVDVSLPEPPSKKARRALKKGKPLPAAKRSSDDEGEAGKDGAVDKASSKKKKERSPYGVWIGNLRFTVTKAELRQWLVDNSGGSIADDMITRVHMPTSKPAAAGGDREKKRGAAAPEPNDDDDETKKPAAENKGFAYVDFSTFDANVAAIALSENELGGRKLLIKDAKSFEGRPKKEPEPRSANADGTGTTTTTAGGAAAASSDATPTSRKIFVGNLGFQTSDDDLWAHFEKCGEIEWVKVATFEDTGKCKGFGWVKFKEAEAAQWAVKGFVKIKEDIETEEDFMDKEEEDEAADGEEDAGDESKKNNKKQTEEKKTRTRKWWVNMLRGRKLKIELAEDDQTRYKKRFGKDAVKKGREDRPARPRNARQDQPAPEKEVSGQTESAKDKKMAFHEDVNVARLTGAAVAPQGKKITFE